MTTFSERLKEALSTRGLTAAELSRRTGISEGIISQYKAGSYVAKQKKLELLSAALDVSIPWLMGQDVPMERNEFTLNNNAELVNHGVIGQVRGDFTTGINQYGLTAQEYDLIRIYRSASGKQQLRLMQVAYEIEEENKKL